MIVSEEAREWSHHQEIQFATTLYRCNHDIDFSLWEHLLTKRRMKVLDLGCNGSYVAQELKQRGHNAWGADLPAVIRQAKWDYPEFTRHLLACNLDTGEVPGNEFDLVLALGVIEHLVNYAEFFPKVAKALKPGGIVFVSTCNRDAIEIDRHHYHHFTGSELAQLAEGAGLKILEINFPSKTNLVGTFQKETT